MSKFLSVSELTSLSVQFKRLACTVVVNNESETLAVMSVKVSYFEESIMPKLAKLLVEGLVSECLKEEVLIYSSVMRYYWQHSVMRSEPVSIALFIKYPAL